MKEINEYAWAEFIMGTMGTMVIISGIATCILTDLPIKIIMGIPLLIIGLFAFYLGYLCMK